MYFWIKDTVIFFYYKSKVPQLTLNIYDNCHAKQIQPGLKSTNYHFFEIIEKTLLGLLFLCMYFFINIWWWGCYLPRCAGKRQKNMDIFLNGIGKMVNFRLINFSQKVQSTKQILTSKLIWHE